MGRSRFKIPESVRSIASFAREAGWVISTDSTGHLVWTGPNGEEVRSGGSPSDYRAVRALRKDLRDEGLPVPSPGYTPPKSKRLTSVQVPAPMSETERHLARDMYGQQARAALDAMLFPSPRPITESEPPAMTETAVLDEVAIESDAITETDELLGDIEGWKSGLRPKFHDTAPPTWQPNAPCDPSPWVCLKCGERFATRFMLGGHGTKHGARGRENKVRDAEQAQAEQAQAEQAQAEQAVITMDGGDPAFDTPPFGVPSISYAEKSQGDVIKSAVREVLLEMLATSESTPDTSVTDKIIENFERQVAFLTREHAEATAALRLILTDYINPRMLTGVIDIAKYIDMPEVDPIV